MVSCRQIHPCQLLDGCYSIAIRIIQGYVKGTVKVGAAVIDDIQVNAYLCACCQCCPGSDGHRGIHLNSIWVDNLQLDEIDIVLVIPDQLPVPSYYLVKCCNVIRTGQKC